MAAAAKVSVRPYRSDDYDAVLCMWQQGFSELAPVIHANLWTPVPLAVLSAVVAATLASGHTTAAGVLAAGVAALLAPQLGGRLVSRLLRGGIRRETKRDMTPAALSSVWNTPGVSAFFVAEEVGTPGRVVGCVGVRGYHTLHKERSRLRSAAAGDAVEAGEASVWRLSVDPQARRLGAGRALMAAAEAWAAAHGYHHLSLITGNPASMLFYGSLGYERESFARGMRVLCPPDGAPSTLAESFQAWLLGRRVSARGTVWVKRLQPAAAPAGTAGSQR